MDWFTGHKRKTYVIGGLIIAVCCFLCARPYLADRAPFSFTEAEGVTRVENRSVFAFPEMMLHRGTYTVQCATNVPSEIEISIQDAEDTGADADVAVAGAFEGVTLARSDSRIEALPVRVPGGENGSRSFRVFVEENGVPARVVIREYYESGGVPPASFDVRVIYRPALSASYAVLRMLFAVLLPFVLWMLIRYRLKNREDTESLIPLLLFVLTMLISAPLLARFVPYGHDTLFHVRRIANLAEEVFSGRIPVRIAQTWKNGYGYPVSIFYGDIFMLEAAVLFKLGVPLWRCYQYYLLSINLATVVFSYHCFRKLSGNAWAGFFGSALYAASVRYLANVYLRGAIGEATAMAFLPVVVCGFYELFAETSLLPADGTVTPARPLAGRFCMFNRRAVTYLVCGFTALIQSHTLTTIQVALFAALFCLLCARRLLREGRLPVLCVSAGLTLLVNLWFIVPFVDYYVRHRFYAKHAEPVADSALKLSELIFPEEMYSAIGKGTLALLLCAIACAVLLHMRRSRTKAPVPAYAHGVFACEVLSVLAVLMGTAVFPWAWLETHLPFVYGILGGRIQYVWRYFSLATLLAVVTAMLVVRAGEYKRTVPLLSCLLLILTCAESAVMLHAAYHPAPDTPVLRAADVWNGDGGDALYMFDDLVWYEVPRAEVTAPESVTVSEVSHAGTAYRCTVENVSAEESFAEFPVWNYYGYAAETDEGSPLAVSDGEGHRVRVAIPAGFSGRLTVGFREPWYWRVAEAVSVAALIGIILFQKRKQMFEKTIDKVKRSGYT